VNISLLVQGEGRPDDIFHNDQKFLIFTYHTAMMLIVINANKAREKKGLKNQRSIKLSPLLVSPLCLVFLDQFHLRNTS
jgi:hypothetical protein